MGGMRVLIVKIGAIGDVVMGLPMIGATRALDAGAHVTWLVGSTARPVLDLVEGLDEVITVDDGALFGGSPVRRLQAMMRVWRHLGRRKFDLVVTAHTDWRYRMLTCFTRARVRRGLSRLGRGASVRGRYAAVEYARLITGSDGPGKVPLFPPHSASWPNPPFLAAAGRKTVIIAPGGARNALRDDPLRRWPTESYASLARDLLEAGCQVVLVGAPHDVYVRPSFGGIEVVDLIGRTSLSELASVVRMADVVVTHDSLALHLAVLAGSRAVALFGPVLPMERCPPDETLFTSAGDAPPPTQRRLHAVWGGQGLKCRPCYDGQNFAVCGRNECMREITAPEVLSYVLRLLGRSDGQRRG